MAAEPTFGHRPRSPTPKPPRGLSEDRPPDFVDIPLNVREVRKRSLGAFLLLGQEQDL